ncbi:MAG: amidophosphoribosyltransferase [Acidobacteriota bacterium]|jgi:amidophosphoribosyltransferase|nr:amidophosphoribosyltransferase [Acidobacteriota bacterium]
MSTLDKLGEECGIFGIMSHPEAARIVYLGLYALQHRGQESAGIVSADGDKLHIEKGMGHVADLFTETRLEKLPGDAALGHVRYSTAGESTSRNAQPIMVDCWRGSLSLAHNGNLTNAPELRRELEQDGAIFHSTSDSEVILHLMSRSRRRTVREAFIEALRQIQGAYSLVVLTPEYLLVARDPHGFRPLCLGRVDGSYVVASETCALDLINAEYIRDVEPGEVLRIRRGVDSEVEILESQMPLTKGKPSFCVFEHIYFSRPDSIVFGRTVNTSRREMGRLLAQEHPVEADVVVPIPDSGVVAAIGFSRASGIPLEFGLIRNHYVGRTFIEPRQSIRNFGVKVKLNPVREILREKRVILLDDSIVRGTTSQKIVNIVRAGGAKEVHLRITSPPLIAPCYYGIDIPTRRELIASTKSVKEICEFIGADSLGYLSLESTLRAVDDKKQFCSACFTGNYPVEVVPLDRQRSLFVEVEGRDDDGR